LIESYLQIIIVQILLEVGGRMIIQIVHRWLGQCEKLCLSNVQWDVSSIALFH